MKYYIPKMPERTGIEHIVVGTLRSGYRVLASKYKEEELYRANEEAWATLASEKVAHHSRKD